ncbi:hypothetical protein BASA60_008625 [Batrachochytrium salamandrivorans]|nr:hypothetical protein BASA60_008625 [Batrachochytrium salamandrivorans]
MSLLDHFEPAHGKPHVAVSTSTSSYLNTVSGLTAANYSTTSSTSTAPQDPSSASAARGYGAVDGLPPSTIHARQDAIEDIVFTTKRRDDYIQYVYFSPAAHHLLISCRSGDNYYLHQRWNKPHLLSKIKGVRIRSVAWGSTETIETTGPILLGSHTGHIFETELTPKEDFFKKEELYYSQVFSLHQDSPVIGLFYEPIPESRNKFIVVAATDCRIYQFIGEARLVESSYFARLFSKYDVNSEYQELPGALANSAMRITHTQFPGSDVFTNLGWLTGAGLYLGKILIKGQASGDTFIDKPQILPYMVSDSKQQTSIITTLISFILTDYHYVLLYPNEIVVVSQLNNQIISHELISLAHQEVVLGMASDLNRKTHWLHTNLSLYEIIVVDEDRDVWKIFLEKKQFQQASIFATTPEQRNIIKESQADSCFSQEQYLKLPSTMLKQKLYTLRKQDLTQTTLIGTWLLEILSGKLCIIEQQLTSIALESQGNLDSEDDAALRLKNVQQQHSTMSMELRSLLKEYKDRLHHPTVYNLLGSHGRNSDLVFFAELINDWEKLVAFFLERREWNKALDIISRQDSVEFYYKHSSILIQHIPKEVIGLWMKVPSLNPRFLMPSMLNLDNFESENQSAKSCLTKYLEYLVSNGNHDRVVHNYLMLLYVSESSPENEAPVLSFIQSQKESPMLDLPHALRICNDRGLVQSSVQLYAMMGLYDEAIHLALRRNDLDLACIIADKLDESDDVRKKLWLRIARHVISNSTDVSSALEYLKVGNLSIEEILPFFPDFVLIDDFKEELCSALEEYNDYITTLKTDLDEATTASENIRHDMRELKNRYIIVPVTESCRCCDRPLMTRQFMAFSCQHSFHTDCLIDVIVRDSVRGKKIMHLRSEIEKDAKNQVSSLSESNRAALKNELNDLVSQECILCGELMIKTIDTPFTTIGEEL